MNKQYIRILSICLLGVMLTGLFAGCSGTENIKEAENTYVTKYSLSTAEQSHDITIDGVLDEAAWQGKGWYTSTYASSDGTMPVVKYTAFPTQYGVYLASVVTDSNLTSDGQRNPEKNTNWEIYLAACNADEDLTDTVNNGAWNRHRIYVDLNGESMSLYTNTERAVTIDGEVNSGSTNGATLELLVPWEALGVDISKGVPEYIGIYPAYRAVLTHGATTKYMFPAGGNYGLPASYHYFGKNGYMNSDQEGSVLGNAKNGYSKSGGWDLTQMEESIVTSVRGSQNFIFFSDECAENFIVETTMIPVRAVNDSYPKGGISFTTTDGLFYTIMLDPGSATGMVDSINGTKNFPNYTITTFDQHNGNWNQKTLSGYNRSNPNATKQEGVKLTVVKYGNQFWYFADDKYLTSEQVSWIEGECYPGFFTLGFEAIYKDYSCKEIDIEDLKSYLSTSGQCVIECEVDGAGGKAAVNTSSVSEGGSYTLSLSTKSGYKLSSVQINGTEMIDIVRKDAKDGVYTFTNVQEHQDIVVAFEKIDGVTYSGIVTDGEDNLRADVVLVNIADGSAYYEDKSAGNKGFDFEIPAGTYEVRVRTDENQWQSKTVTILEDMEDHIIYQVISEEAES